MDDNKTARQPATVITFYSYKGGTGRSMALANVAWILASCGKRVLVIDWDLEAPGLHRYFQPFLVDRDLVDTDGLIDYLWTVTRSIMTPPGSSEPVAAPPLPPDLLDYVVGLEWQFEAGGVLDFIPAGRQGANYAQRVNSFDWANFYRRLGGGPALNVIRERLRAEYEYILIDSRTGVSDTSGICTVQLPDILVGLFTLNNQSIEGVAAIFDSALELRREDEGKLIVFPVVSRVEDGEQVKLEVARTRARAVFARFLPQNSARDSRRYWDDMEVPYKKFYAYEEVLATFGDRAGAYGAEATLLAKMERLTRRVTGKDEFAMPELRESERQAILRKFSFGEPVNLDLLGDDPTLRQVYEKVLEKHEKWRENEADMLYTLSSSLLDQMDVFQFDFATVNPKLGDYIRLSRDWREFRERQVRWSMYVFGAVAVVGLALAAVTVLWGKLSWEVWLPWFFLGFYLVVFLSIFAVKRPPTIKIYHVFFSVFLAPMRLMAKNVFNVLRPSKNENGAGKKRVRNQR